MDGDDTEGYPFEPIALGDEPGPSSSDIAAIPSPLSSPDLDLAPSPPLVSGPPGSSSTMQSCKTLKCTRGSADDICRKKRGNSRRAMRRLEEKRAAGHSDYAVKPRIINKYIQPAVAAGVKFDALKLRHTKSAYTGGRLKAASRRVYNLDELVGERSIFKFKLEKWDGKYAA
jgi:hypothetical protein